MLASPAFSETVRNVTPRGVTPGPVVTGPLIRVPGVEPPPPRIRTRRLYRIDVLDTARFAGTHRGKRWEITLPGLVGVSSDTQCALPDGGHWPCGAQTIRAVRFYLRRSPLECAFADDGAEIITADCRVRGKDFATILLRRGWAYAGAAAGANHRKLERWARQSKSGLFRPAEDALAEWRALENLSTRQGALPPPPDLPIPDILAPFLALPQTPDRGRSN